MSVSGRRLRGCHREHRAGEVDPGRRSRRLAHLEVLDEQGRHDLHAARVPPSPGICDVTVTTPSGGTPVTTASCQVGQPAPPKGLDGIAVRRHLVVASTSPAGWASRACGRPGVGLRRASPSTFRRRRSRRCGRGRSNMVWPSASTGASSTSTTGLPDDLTGSCALVICQRFRDPRLYPQLVTALAPGRVARDHRAVTRWAPTASPARSTLAPGELIAAFSSTRRRRSNDRSRPTARPRSWRAVIRRRRNSKRSNTVAMSGSNVESDRRQRAREELGDASSSQLSRVRSPSPSSHANWSSTLDSGPTRTSVVSRTARACPAPSVTIEKSPTRGHGVAGQGVLGDRAGGRSLGPIDHQRQQLVGELDTVAERFDQGRQRRTGRHALQRRSRATRTRPLAARRRRAAGCSSSAKANRTRRLWRPLFSTLVITIGRDWPVLERCVPPHAWRSMPSMSMNRSRPSGVGGGATDMLRTKPSVVAASPAST